MSDRELLQRYFDEGGYDAFKTLVERHLNLVYSVARRHVKSAALAEDVAQSVFVELAQQGRTLKPGTPLIAWLHVVSRRRAINAARDEARRHAREQAAALLAEMKTSSPPPDWSAIEPLLDEAVESLAERDRAAILLRFFENKNLRDVGAALGVSDDAAQKRVARALDELRIFFARRGVMLSATGLTATLSTHAIEVAPTALLAAITSAPGFTIGAIQTTHVVAMTSLQKSLAAAALAATAGIGIFQLALIARQSTQLEASHFATAQLASDVRVAAKTRDAVSTQLDSLEQEIDAKLAAGPAVNPHDAALEAQMKQWFVQLDQMKALLAQHPEWNIPELNILTDNDWFTTASADRLDSEQKLRVALADLRSKAEERFNSRLMAALRAYLKAHGNAFPTHPGALAVFLPPGSDPMVLERYEILRGERASALSAKQQTTIFALKKPADVELDKFRWFSASGTGSSNALNYNITQARRAYAAANGGQPATMAAQLAPFLKWPLAEAIVQRHLDPAVAGKTP